MIAIRLLLFVAQAKADDAPKPPDEVAALLRQIVKSGQIVEITAKPDERLAPPARIAPGPPPFLRFRGLEGQLRHRFGDLDLVVDDAGH
jgi:hypothetical protein